MVQAKFTSKLWLVPLSVLANCFLSLQRFLALVPQIPCHTDPCGEASVAQGPSRHKRQVGHCQRAPKPAVSILILIGSSPVIVGLLAGTPNYTCA